MKYLLTSLTFFFFCFLFAQETSRSISRKSKDIQSIDTISLIEQFSFLVDNSDSYKSYKVIHSDWIQKYERNLSDSIQKFTKDFASKEIQFKALENKKMKQDEKVLNLENDLSKKNLISFLGIKMTKSNYQLFVWGLILVLMAALGYYFYSYRNAFKITKEAKDNYAELEEEYNNSRTKALEREQALNRKLLDEIKKNG